MQYYTTKKGNEIIPFLATCRDIEIILSEVSETEKDKYITYMWNLKYDTNELIYKTENGLTDVENKFMVNREERGWERDKLGVLG